MKNPTVNIHITQTQPYEMTEVTRVVLIMEHLAVFVLFYLLLARLYFEVSDCSLHRRCISDTTKHIVMYNMLRILCNIIIHIFDIE